jgi:deazaflavin-dependent oxidoreductase (nitroreductase family)
MSDEEVSEQVLDSPIDWVAEHVRGYVESRGRQGHLYHGVPTLLLTTRGRRTGALRRTALIYGQAGESYLVVASNGGKPNHPLWYLNLLESPDVQVQVGPELFDAYARPAIAVERPLLWQQMAELFPTYNGYQANAGREIPVVILDRA